MFKKWMKNVAFAVALSVTLATTGMPATVFADVNTNIEVMDATQTGYGTASTQLVAGKYTVPASLMKSDDITASSMAASCIAGDATIEVGADGSVKATVPITAVTVMGMTAYSTDWKVYSAGVDSETTDAEYTTDTDGNVNSITFTVPDVTTDGVYVSMVAMNRTQKAFIKLDYANAGIVLNTAEITTAIDETATLNQKDYTEESWKNLQEKVEAAKKAISESKSQEEIDAAVKALDEAVNSLKKAETQTTTTTTEAKITTAATKNYTVSGKKYKVLKGKTVAFTGTTSKKATKVTVPATIKIKGVTYKVTGIADKAFKNNKKIKSVTIGSQVKTIGSEAFKGCSKLKKITVKTKKLSKIGSKAFKGINKKAVIKVPSSKKKAYKKLFKGKGQKKTVVVK